MVAVAKTAVSFDIDLYFDQAEKQPLFVLVLTQTIALSPLFTVEVNSYGAEAIVIMDSAGAYFPDDVTERISTLVDGLSIPIGFHGHNNLGMAISNSVAAVKAGASILDGSIRGFGAGAGNTQLEVLIAVLGRLGFDTGIDLYKILDAADVAEDLLSTITIAT
jgi:4-hydroxy 2-oxovalerate aldolase